MIHYPPPLQQLIDVFKKLPGIGVKSAERFAFHILDWDPDKLAEMGDTIKEIKKHLVFCPECGALCAAEEAQCTLCHDPHRQQQSLCLIASPKDIFAIEETGEYRGLYHVLGALLSPLHGMAPHPEAIERLCQRIECLEVKEVILAFDSTLEGDTTALYVKKALETRFAKAPLRLSRPALGLPMGTALEFIDGGTLGRALAGRHAY